jgi:sulfite reductase (NADPH) hemoprotein beta-component
MYKYNDFDEAFVRERVAQFRGQVERRIDGSLTEDEFKPLRLMNGLYLQLHAYMLRDSLRDVERRTNASARVYRRDL